MFSKPNKLTLPSTSIHDLRAFRTFFDGWLVRQEHYLEELKSTLQNCQDSKEDDLKDLVSRVLAHYQEYYEQKSRMANRNVFLVFTPPWFTPFERSFFWIAGFKPNLAFNVLAASVEDMTEEQRQRMEQLRDDVGAEERELGNKLARIQETVASPSLVEMARRVGAPVDGEIYQVDVALETLRAAMEAVLANADMLRARTAEQVASILSPLQNIKFLASVTQLQLQIRMWGLQKEAEAHVTNV